MRRNACVSGGCRIQFLILRHDGSMRCRLTEFDSSSAPRLVVACAALLKNRDYRRAPREYSVGVPMFCFR